MAFAAGVARRQVDLISATIGKLDHGLGAGRVSAVQETVARLGGEIPEVIIGIRRIVREADYGSATAVDGARFVDATISDWFLGYTHILHDSVRTTLISYDEGDCLLTILRKNVLWVGFGRGRTIFEDPQVLPGSAGFIEQLRRISGTNHFGGAEGCPWT